MGITILLAIAGSIFVSMAEGSWWVGGIIGGMAGVLIWAFQRKVKSAKNSDLAALIPSHRKSNVFMSEPSAFHPTGIDLTGQNRKAPLMPRCEICSEFLSDDHKKLGRHLWEQHHITPNDYRIRYLGLPPKCKRPGCDNPVPRCTDGGWFKCCSPHCALEMGEDIPLQL